MRKEIQELLDSDMTGYKIFKATGVSQSVISDLRKGKRSLDNLSLLNAERLYEYQLKLKASKERPKSAQTKQEP